MTPQNTPVASERVSHAFDRRMASPSLPSPHVYTAPRVVEMIVWRAEHEMLAMALLGAMLLVAMLGTCWAGLIDRDCPGMQPASYVDDRGCIP